MLLNNFLNHLDKVTQRGDQYTALCPGHDDKKPSLAITEREGKILVKCWSGCTTEDITDALGLEIKDLFSESNFTTQQRQQYRSKKTVRQCLEMLEIEVHVFYQCIVQLLHTDKPLSNEDKARNSLAQTRIIKLIGQIDDARRV